MKKILIGISGASGVNLGLKLAFEASKSSFCHIIISQNAKTVLEKEQNLSLNDKTHDNELNRLWQEVQKNAQIYDDSDISAAPASGSFGIEATIIAPCSINTLAKIHAGLADMLITRAAAVALKERKRLVLGVREMPLSTISLEQMAKLSNLGAIIAPPILGYYSEIKNLDDIQNFIIGKWLDLLGVKNEIYKRWNG